MSGRFEILDIIFQDEEGVIFHAEDRESKQEVILRRFFPFGPDGGGLEGEERTAYEIAVRRLMKITHPALRKVIAGGTDPVDGMPFLVTECVPGQPLAERLAERPLSPASALALADIAIETSIVLSETFGEEAIWVDTQTEAIMLGEADTERSVTFWISPLRWLGNSDSRQGLRPLLEMIEQVTGWKGQVISDSSGDGLGAWLKTIREDPDAWNLVQARRALHKQPELRPPPVATAPLSSTPAQTPIAPTIKVPPPTPKPDNNWWPWAITGMLAIVAAGFMFWKGLTPQEVQAPFNPAKKTSPKPLSAAEKASQLAEKLAKEIEEYAILPDPGHRILAPSETNARLIDAGTKLRGQLGDTISFKGCLYEVRSSQSGKTIYLEFGSSSAPNALCGRHRTSGSELSEEMLQKHVGKIIAITGKVVSDTSGRIAIDIASADKLKVLDE